MAERPFFQMTLSLLNGVRDHDFEVLAEQCDDDYGIIDINTEGGAQIIRDRKGWEDWFQGLFKQLSGMGAETWSEITNYEVVERSDMSYSVVDFDQILIVQGVRRRFAVIATIIWKKMEDGSWKESRYHSSLVSVKEE